MLVNRPAPTDDERVAPTVDSSAPAVPGGSGPAVLRRPANERIDVRVALGIGIAWFVLPSIGAALEPAAQQSEPGWATLAGYALDVVFLAMLLGLALRRRWGLSASLAGAAVLTAFAVACPTSGHHAFGLWWLGQMACVLALVAGTVWALRLPPVEEPQRS